MPQHNHQEGNLGKIISFESEESSVSSSTDGPLGNDFNKHADKGGNAQNEKFLKLYSDVGKQTRQLERRIRQSNAAFKSSIEAEMTDNIASNSYSYNTSARGATTPASPASTDLSHLKGFSDGWQNGSTSKFLSRVKRHAVKTASAYSDPSSLHSAYAKPKFVASQYYGLS
jgi:hypothetical protein